MPDNVAPFEIIVQPFEVWTAVADTPEQTDLAVPPTTPWELLGQMGKIEITDDGVTVTHNQSIEEIRGQGTAPLKAARTEEGVTIAFSIMDLTLETYKHVLNENAITEVAPGAGTVGTRSIDFYRGPLVVNFALILRGPSPYLDSFAQYYVPRAFLSGEPEVVFNKSEAAGLAFEFHALYNEAGTPKLGRLKAIHAAAL